jgi:ABC-type transporter Mla subunit MlaD
VVELQTAATIVENLPGAVTAWATGTANEATRRIADALTINRLALAKMEEERKALIAEYEKDVARIANAEAGAPTGEALKQQMQADAKVVMEAVKSGRQRYEEEIAKLRELLDGGLIDRDTFNKRQKQLEKQYLEAGKKSGKAFVDGAAETAKKMADVAERVMRDMQDAAARIFTETRTVAENAAAKLEEINQLFRAGLISEETATRAARAAEADRDRDRLAALAEIKAQADQVRESVMTDMERLERSGAELERLFLGGDIDRVTYIAAIQKLNEELDPATQKMRELEEAGKALREQLKTKDEALGDELKRINELLAAGVISADDYQRALKKLFPDVEKTFTDMERLGAGAANNLASTFSEFLFDPFNASLGEMVKNFALSLAKMVTDLLAKRAVLALLGAFGASEEFIKLAGFAEGGYVAGPGTGTSDSIPARLSNGEYVMPADTVRHYGRDFMDALRAMRPQREAPVARFAEGGYVDGQGGGGGGGVRVVNVVDGSMVQDFLTSSAGEQVILNTIRRNRRQVSQVMA